MRQVISTDLSDEQDDILLGAPLSGVILISGPPGSGKTVMAFHRAEALATKFETVNVVMFNSVLSRFSNNATSEEKIQVKTFHSWFYRWWQAATKTRVIESAKFKPNFTALFDDLIKRESEDNLDLKKLNWGHVIIDEAQDFSNKHYQFLNKVKTAFYSGDEMPSATILADENQMLFDDNSTLKQIRDTFKIDKAKSVPSSPL